MLHACVLGVYFLSLKRIVQYACQRTSGGSGKQLQTVQLVHCPHQRSGDKPDTASRASENQVLPHSYSSSLKQEKCPQISVEELIVDPTSLQDYTPEKSISFGMASVLGMYQCRDDPEILSLLGFDPYFIIGDDLLEKLFPLNSEEAERIISDSDVELFAAAFKNHSSALASILDYSLQTEKIDPQERMRVTRTIITEWMEKGRGLYVDLRKELDKFSIFAGRNPVVRTATPASASTLLITIFLLYRN